MLLRNPQSISNIASLACIALLITFSSGCSKSGPELAVVTGTVTLDGKPLAKAGVVFEPMLGAIATGVTDEEGKFQLFTANQEGALVGEHNISVGISERASNSADEMGVMGAPIRNTRPTRSQLPKKYRSTETSGLTETVVGGDKNVFHIELSSKE